MNTNRIHPASVQAPFFLDAGNQRAEGDDHSGRRIPFNSPILREKMQKFTEICGKFGITSPEVDAFIEANASDKDFLTAAKGLRSIAELGISNGDQAGFQR